MKGNTVSIKMSNHRNRCAYRFRVTTTIKKNIVWWIRIVIRSMWCCANLWNVSFLSPIFVRLRLHPFPMCAVKIYTLFNRQDVYHLTRHQSHDVWQTIDYFNEIISHFQLLCKHKNSHLNISIHRMIIWWIA